MRFRWDASVPKYDAFGREIGEDTLAGLGSTSSPGSAQPARPEPAQRRFSEAELAAASSLETPTRGHEAAPEEEGPAPAFSMPTPSAAQAAPSVEVPVTAIPGAPGRRRASGLGCLISLMVLCAIIAVPVLIVVSIAGQAGGVIDDVKDAFDSATEDATRDGVPADGGDGPAPTGITGRSLIAPANLRQALTRLRGANLGRPGTLRLAPDRIDAVMVKGTRQTAAQLTYAGDLAHADAGSATGTTATVPFGAIDARAPSRLVRGSAARFKVGAGSIDYLVLSRFPGTGVQWVAYFKGGTYVQGDARGRVVRRIS
jgi:hypothetical protein